MAELAYGPHVSLLLFPTLTELATSDQLFYHAGLPLLSGASAMLDYGGVGEGAQPLSSIAAPLVVAKKRGWRGPSFGPLSGS